MAQDAWNPALYDRFRDERSRPFFDILTLVRPKPAMRVVDLGCGTGELTRNLHRHLQARETLGIDSSQTMLARSLAYTGQGLRFERQEIMDFVAADTGGWDLVFSNAALHWVPLHDHLLRRLTALLAPGGQLAIQVPANHDHPSQVVAAEVAQEPPFREALKAYFRRAPVLAPEEYALVLDRQGYREQHVRLEVYGHRLQSRDEVVEWMKGTLLNDYEARMPAEIFPEFVARYRERLLPRLEDNRPYFFPYKRILIWAKR